MDDTWGTLLEVVLWPPHALCTHVHAHTHSRSGEVISVTNSLLKQSQWFVAPSTVCYNRGTQQKAHTASQDLNSTCSLRIHPKQDLIFLIHPHPAFIYEKLLSPPSVNHFTFSQANDFCPWPVLCQPGNVPHGWSFFSVQHPGIKFLDLLLNFGLTLLPTQILPSSRS